MPTTMDQVEDTRIRLLNDKPVSDGKYVLYWMQQSQRAEMNHALEYAIVQGNRLGKGVVVAFGLFGGYPEANERHFTFMIEGLKETEALLIKRGIQMVIRLGPPPDVAHSLGREASLIVCDTGYLRHQRAWRQSVACEASCRVVQVESDVIIPVETASPKAEIGARTLRPKIRRLLPEYLKVLKPARVKTPSLNLPLKGESIRAPEALLRKLSIDRSVKPVSHWFRGGTSEAKRRFKTFLKDHLPHYDQHHNQPQTDDISHMSPYLHFGQISPLYLLLEVRRDSDYPSARDAYVEELVVRRELACNFTYYTTNYDSYTCLPKWAHISLDVRRKDPRPVIYDREALENGRTHDRYWNAAMIEMKETGFMHNYMRMYWGKKILEWSKTPEDAFTLTLALNNRYFLDGRDPNSYAGVAWVFGMHDRAWPDRPIYGKVRTMMASGLERKCDIAAYVRKVENLLTVG